ncbi:MAG: anti-sigma factor [Planctomycetes bacterium]|nr:anti-sigma factor [Planctomycetota bacterium]
MSTRRDPSSPNGRDGRARLDALLVDRATQGLSTVEARELDQLAAQHPDVDCDAYDVAAAALHLHMSSRETEALPAHLRQRILDSAPTQVAVPSRRAASVEPRAPSRFMLLSGWVAAAAAIVIAIVVLRSRPAPAVTPNESIVERVERAGDALRRAWKPTEDPDGRTVSGEVVWSPSTQSGYMKFSGLPANDPRVRQYQLWIFDAQQDDRYPVDGGVFDIAAATTNAQGETIVPITAKLRVVEPKLFAITIEKPGGVVVSSREHIVALASL